MKTNSGKMGPTDLLIQYVFSKRLPIFILAAVMVLELFFTLFTPEILGNFISSVESRAEVNYLIKIAGIYICCVILQQMINIFSIFMSQSIGWQAINELKNDILEHLMGSKIEYFKSVLPGEIVERIEGDTEQLLEFLSTVAIYGFPSENCIRNFLHILMSRWQAPKILPHAGRRGLFLLS